MFRAFTKYCLALLFLAAARQSALGFALLGPFEAYQTATIGYQEAGDLGGPRQIGEGFRWNTKNLFYACDANFFNYFGSNGLAAVDNAFAIMNNLQPVSSYSSDLSEWTFNSSRINQTAQALGLVDLKTEILHLLIEQMGLAQPDRYTWTLFSRAPGTACPVTAIYQVVQRNFDPVTTDESSYVNGTLYTYEIIETCTGPNPLAHTQMISPDPTAELLTAVAAQDVGAGLFLTGLTRDDVGGLRYQYASNRVYTEGVAPGALLQASAVPTLIVTTNLASLVAAEQTNAPLAVQTLFPTLQFTSTFLYYSNVVTTNITAFFTNLPGSQAGSPATLEETLTFTTNLLPIYSYTNLNVITNFVYTNFGVPVTNQIAQQGMVTLQETIVGPLIGGQVGTLTTNVINTTFLSNFITGEVFFIPANACGYTILSNVLTQVTPVTNAVALTATATNVGVQSFSIVTLFTNHTLVVEIPTCQAGTVTLREGVEKINFFNTEFDSYLSTVFVPITNTYTLTDITNFTPQTDTFYRVITQPDFLITAANTEPGALGVVRNINFVPETAGGGLAGTINPPVTFTLDNAGPIYQNPGNAAFLPTFTEGSQALQLQWGSFDGTTNLPIAYPNGTSIASLENNIFLQILVTGPLPDGNINRAYSVQLQAKGAQPQPPLYTWTIPATIGGVPNALPGGLSFTSTNTTGVVIGGVPNATGIFDFTIQVQDSAGRINQRNFTLEIDP